MVVCCRALETDDYCHVNATYYLLERLRTQQTPTRTPRSVSTVSPAETLHSILHHHFAFFASFVPCEFYYLFTYFSRQRQF